MHIFSYPVEYTLEHLYFASWFFISIKKLILMLTVSQKRTLVDVYVPGFKVFLQIECIYKAS